MTKRGRAASVTFPKLGIDQIITDDPFTEAWSETSATPANIIGDIRAAIAALGRNNITLEPKPLYGTHFVGQKPALETVKDASGRYKVKQ